MLYQYYIATNDLASAERVRRAVAKTVNTTSLLIVELDKADSELLSNAELAQSKIIQTAQKAAIEQMNQEYD